MNRNKANPKMALFWKKNILSDVRQSRTKKILSSILAIFCALVIALIIACSICKTWPKLGPIIGTIFTSGFKKTNINQLFSTMSIMLVAGLSFIFAYKAGLFNIGISGQMLMGGTVGTIVCHLGKLSPGANQVVVLLVSMLSAALVAALVGVLKAFLNVNEVVSSIMLNWIIYFLTILLLSSLAAKGLLPKDTSGLNTDAPNSALLFRIGKESYGPLLIMSAILVIIVAVILNYTVFGKKQKVVGLSRSGALAVGYNVKLNMIASMAISGAIAGVLGAMNYCGYSPQMAITASAKSIPQEGFNGISIGLIAMCSPVAAIPASLFFSMVQTSVAPLQSLGIDNHIAQVVFGIVVYGAAAISLFLNLKPYWLTLHIFKGKNYSKIKHEQNVTDIALIELATDHNASLKKYYNYFTKKAKIRSTLKATPWMKVKIGWANFKYAFVVLWYEKIRKFDAKRMNTVKSYQKLINERNGLEYRYAIASQNVMDFQEYEAVNILAKGNGLPVIQDKEQYRLALNVFCKAYYLTALEVKKYYDNIRKEYAKSKKDDKKALDPTILKYDLVAMEKSYMRHLREEIARNRVKINKETFFKESAMRSSTWEGD